MNQNGNADPIMQSMKKYNMPMTRESYIGLAYPEGIPNDAELESMLPKQFQAPVDPNKPANHS
jgi:hypothetical protein